MDEAKLLEAISALGEALRTEVADSLTKINARVDAISDSVTKARRDGAGMDGNRQNQGRMDGDEANMAEETAADRRADAVSRSELRVMQAQINRLATAAPRVRSASDRDAFATAQSRADVAFRALGERADQPMVGEELVNYEIRLHRGLQRKLPKGNKWSGVELSTIAADSSTFQIALDGIRADAYAAGLNPVDLPMFQHREIKTESPGGHRVTSFVGTGTIFHQMSRPGRKVIGFGGDHRYGREIRGGAINIKAHD
jgi:colicin import membrane protein